MNAHYSHAVFCYSYLVYHPSDLSFAGFTVNLYADDSLVYATYDASRRQTGEYAFRVGPEIRERYFRLLNYAEPWLRHVPDRIGSGPNPRSESSFGLSGRPMFRVEDLSSLLTLSFGSQRGHYARQLYNLLEDISSLMATYGFELSPEGFNWLPDVVEQTPQQYLNA